MKLYDNIRNINNKYLFDIAAYLITIPCEKSITIRDDTIRLSLL
jgi:hypothetical protein